MSTDLSAIFGNMPPTILAIWGVFAIVMAVAIVVAIFCERRWYAVRNKVGAWMLVRLATVPIAVATVAVVVVPARAVGGPEALAIFYLLVVTAAPLAYFGLHWIVGSIAGLSRKEALAIGLSGLFMVLMPVLLANEAQRWVFDLARNIDGVDTAHGSNLPLGKNKPRRHEVIEQHRFALPEIGEVWTERWRAPPRVQVERVELEVRGQYVDVSGANSTYLCRNGEDVHVFWHGAVAPAHWRLHWKSAEGVRAYSDWTMTAPAEAAVAFSPEWLPDGFSLPVPVPSSMVSYTWMQENGREDSRSVLDSRLGADVSPACVQTLRRPVNGTQGQINGLNVRMWRFDTQQMLYVRLRRPVAAVIGSGSANE